VTVLDASAVLAFLQGESGADRVEAELDGGVIGAANWSEVAQKVRASGGDWGIARSLLLSYDVRVEPVGAADAEGAAVRWRRGSGLSLSAIGSAWLWRIGWASRHSPPIAPGAKRRASSRSADSTGGRSDPAFTLTSTRS